MPANARYTLSRTEGAKGAEMVLGWGAPMNAGLCEIHFGSHRGRRGRGDGSGLECANEFRPLRDVLRSRGGKGRHAGRFHATVAEATVAWNDVGMGSLPTSCFRLHTSFIPIQYRQKSCHPPPSQERRECEYQPAAQSPCHCGAHTSNHATDK